MPRGGVKTSCHEIGSSGTSCHEIGASGTSGNFVPRGLELVNFVRRDGNSRATRWGVRGTRS